MMKFGVCITLLDSFLLASLFLICSLLFDLEMQLFLCMTPSQQFVYGQRSYFLKIVKKLDNKSKILD